MISFLCKGLSRVFSSSTVQRHQFFSTQPFLLSNSHIIHDYWKNHSFDYTDIYQLGFILLLLSRFNRVRLFAALRTAAHQASPSTISWSLLKLMFIESVMPSNHLIVCRPFSSCPESFPAPGSFPKISLNPSENKETVTYQRGLDRR